MTIERTAHLNQLRRERPRAWFPRFSGMIILLLLAGSWIGSGLDFGDLTSDRSAENLNRFLREIRPHPLWDRSFDFGIFWEWIQTVLEDKGTRAITVTLAISVAAITLAGIGGVIISPLAAKTLAVPHPYLGERTAENRWANGSWKAVRGLARLCLIFLRAIPEYILAFLLVTLIGAGAWPAVLALALHNLGILGKLYGDSLENLDQSVPATFRGWGSSRKQIAVFALLPADLGRFLLYFFYRWETCVREATVLGLLGVVSLGWFIQDARSRTHYDEMILFVAMGAALILVGDLVSALARRQIRRD